MNNFTKIIVVLACTTLTCCGGGGDGGGGGGGDLISTTEAASITAIFTTATPNATDREEFTPNDWEGILCPPDLIQLQNHDPDRLEAPADNLWIVNNCEITVTLGLCVFKGSLEQPVGGLDQCATDPLDTPWDRLTQVAITPGEFGVWYPSTGNLSVMVYWCSDAQTLTAPPFSTKVSCILP